MNKYISATSTHIKISLPLILGLMVGLNFPDLKLSFDWVLFIIIGLIILLLWYNFFNNNKITAKYLRLAILIIFLSSLGFLRGSWQNAALNQLILISRPANKYFIIIEIKELQKKNRAIGRIKYLLKNDSWQYIDQKIMIYINPTIKDITLNQEILYQGKIKIINETLINKKPFYKYLKRQNIHSYITIYSGNYKILSYKSNRINYEYFLQCIKNKIGEVFNRFMKNEKAIALATALLYGDKQNIDSDIIKAYSNSGVIHVIAVSGLHVSLLYGFLMLIIKIFTKRFNLPKIINLIISLSVLWIFTALASFSPSIVRASLSFSLLIIGEFFQKKVFSLNNLFAIAWLILWFKPLIIFNLGFQFSFLAVWGIIVYSRILKSLLQFNNYILSYIWAGICVCIAAQITTFPLLIYHFKQFPTLFIFSNMVVIFFSTIILYLIIILLLVYWIPWVGVYIGKLLDILITEMNNFVLNFNQISYNLIKIEGWQNYMVVGYYLMLLVITYFLYFNSKISNSKS